MQHSSGSYIHECRQDTVSIWVLYILIHPSISTEVGILIKTGANTNLKKKLRQRPTQAVMSLSQQNRKRISNLNF